MDCPELNALAEHLHIPGPRAWAGEDPGWWWLAREGAEPVGVVLLAKLPSSGGWQVSYMGLVPEARRQGHGRELILHALHQARAARATHAVLDVDVRNFPAWHLYRRLGFKAVGAKELFLAKGIQVE